MFIESSLLSIRHCAGTNRSLLPSGKIHVKCIFNRYKVAVVIKCQKAVTSTNASCSPEIELVLFFNVKTVKLACLSRLYFQPEIFFFFPFIEKTFLFCC